MPNTEVSIHVVAGIIRHPKNPAKMFFTLRQKGQHLENLWEFPGGKQESGESRFQALRRELEEEVGIHVIAAQPFQSVSHRYPGKKVCLDVWEVKQYSGQAHGREGQESAWLDLDEVFSYPFPEADLPILKALTLPPELLITPDMPAQGMDDCLASFNRLMQQHRYPLVQFRSHGLLDMDYLDAANELQSICWHHDAELIINRPSLDSLNSSCFDGFRRRHLSALNLRALSQESFEPDVRYSASCHGREELSLAEDWGCDFALLSAVRATASHPGADAKGWYRFRAEAIQTNIPVYALGGIQRKDLTVARYQAAIGVAGIQDFWG